MKYLCINTYMYLKKNGSKDKIFEHMIVKVLYADEEGVVIDLTDTTELKLSFQAFNFCFKPV